VKHTVDGHDDADASQRGDELLARRAMRRDPAAWSEIFEAHYANVYAFVRSRLGNMADAEDIAAQAFEVALARADRFDYRGVPIEAWLVGIARNLVRDHLKRSARRGSGDELDEGLAPTGRDESGAADLRNDLQQAMEGLTEDQQTVLALRFLLDRSVAETAAVMERSEDAVKNLQRRALAAMQRSMLASGYPPPRVQ
jgi:RNA polymerase sigma-70 factor (ECF subfamily)